MAALFWMCVGGISVALACFCWWVWHTRKSSFSADALSPVSQQHIDLFNGNPLNEAELDSMKEKFDRWLHLGELERIRSTLIPGLHYVVRVRALAELGTEEACLILEQELGRRITDDPIEQSWYWIDVAHCLRMLAREESLPLLLKRLQSNDDFPLVHFYASELVTFHRFHGTLREFPDQLGQAAARGLLRTLEGFRCGISPRLMGEARLGEMVETLWDDHHHMQHPLLVRLFAEVLRHLRRGTQFARDMEQEPFELEAYRLQLSRLTALESHLDGYLNRSKQALPWQLRQSAPTDWRDWFEALQEVRADAGEALVSLLQERSDLPQADQAVLALGWSKSPQARAYLQETAVRCLVVQPRRAGASSVAKSQHERMVIASLLALRHHPSLESEQVLLVGARAVDSSIKRAAISSLGWWEPIRRQAVLMYLQDARFDHDPEVRHAARSALARLGERQSLQWFRQGLSSSNRQIVLEAIHTIAQDGITLLWPELDQLVDEEEQELASCAREALEQMQEELDRDWSLG